MNDLNIEAQNTISILMLAFNGGQDAIEAIESLQHQRKFINSIFISDNSSTDNTRQIIEKKKDNLNITHVTPNENLGFAGGFNHLFDTALRESTAEYFLVLNNDTEAEEGFLENLLREATPERIVSPMILWHKDRKTVIQCAGSFNREMIKMDNLFAGLEREQVPAGVHQVEQTDGCCFLIHRSWLEKGFRFNPDLFIYFEDVDLFLRLGKAGVSFHYVSDSVLYHKEYGASGGREKPSPFRNYYFYRNRLHIARLIHQVPKRWRIYWRLWRLAREKAKEIEREHPEAAGAIHRGIKDFFTGNMGRNLTP